jgi:hypothetical protein
MLKHSSKHRLLLTDKYSSNYCSSSSSNSSSSEMLQCLASLPTQVCKRPLFTLTQQSVPVLCACRAAIELRCCACSTYTTHNVRYLIVCTILHMACLCSVSDMRTAAMHHKYTELACTSTSRDTCLCIQQKCLACCWCAESLQSLYTVSITTLDTYLILLLQASLYCSTLAFKTALNCRQTRPIPA